MALAFHCGGGHYSLPGRVVCTLNGESIIQREQEGGREEFGSISPPNGRIRLGFLVEVVERRVINRLAEYGVASCRVACAALDRRRGVRIGGWWKAIHIDFQGVT
jgi:hypothetical protein